MKYRVNNLVSNLYADVMAKSPELAAQKYLDTVDTTATLDDLVVDLVADGDNTHGQTTAEEWADEWAGNANPTTEETPIPKLPRGSVAAFIRGGIYCATVQEMDAAAEKYGRNWGRVKTALLKVVGNDKETRDFYRDATVFEMHLILAWHTSSIKDLI